MGPASRVRADGDLYERDGSPGWSGLAVEAEAGDRSGAELGTGPAPDARARAVGDPYRPGDPVARHLLPGEVDLDLPGQVRAQELLRGGAPDGPVVRRERGCRLQLDVVREQ